MTLLLQGILFGWSVAWPPGPINAEILRHGIQKAYGKAVAIGLGACSGDFIWALLVAGGASWLAQVVPKEISSSGRSVYLLGLGLALSSPWNISFWIAVIGQQAANHFTFLSALSLAGAVLLGALLWIGVFTLAIRLGARFFTHRWWLIGTELATGLLMGFFFLRLFWRLTSSFLHSN